MQKNIYVIFLSVVISVFLWVSISLTNDYTAVIKLPIKFFNVPESYVLTVPSNNEVSVKVRGKGWNLLSQMITKQNDFSVDAGKSLKKDQKIKLADYSSDNTWLTAKFQILGIEPETISFTFEKLGHSKVKIVPNLQLEFKSGYGLANEVNIVPDSVQVSGPINLVQGLEEVHTKLLSLTNLSEKGDYKVELSDIPGLVYNFQTVTVQLNVQRIVEKSFEDVNIKIFDVPSDRDVVLLPNKISVLLRGGIDVLGKLNNQEIFASIYYRDAVLDTSGMIKPVVQIPKYTELVSMKPEKLKYVIKKFNK